MIHLGGVSISYAQRRVLAGVTLDITAPVTALVGPSGSGKSSLLRVIGGLQTPTSGDVLIDGISVRRQAWSTPADERVAFVHQDYRLVEFLSVADNISLAAELRGLTIGNDEVSQALDRVGLGAGMSTRLPGTLSGGEQQRVALARAIVCKVAVLLADEPTGALDLHNTELVATLLREIAAVGDIQVVVATHDPVVAAGVDVVVHMAELGIQPAASA